MYGGYAHIVLKIGFALVLSGFGIGAYSYWQTPQSQPAAEVALDVSETDTPSEAVVAEGDAPNRADEAATPGLWSKMTGWWGGEAADPAPATGDVVAGEVTETPADAQPLGEAASDAPVAAEASGTVGLWARLFGSRAETQQTAEVTPEEEPVSVRRERVVVNRLIQGDLVGACGGGKVCGVSQDDVQISP